MGIILSHPSKSRTKRVFSETKFKIIETGGHNINLLNRYIIQESPEFLCSDYLQKFLKREFLNGIRKNTFGTAAPQTSHAYYKVNVSHCSTYW